MVYPIAVGGEKTHDGGMPEKAQRRRFTAVYKLKVLQEADQATAPGALGALLRREGLYSSHLAAWRAARRRGELAGLARRRGPKPVRPDPTAARVARLERHLAAALKWAERAEAIVEIQKNSRRSSRARSPRTSRRNGDDCRSGPDVRRAGAVSRAPGAPGHLLPAAQPGAAAPAPPGQTAGADAGGAAAGPRGLARAAVRRSGAGPGLRDVAR